MRIKNKYKDNKQLFIIFRIKMSIVKSSFNVCSKDIKLLIFDMAGTTVNEHGIVYQTLYDTLQNYGINVSIKDIEKWHGANKYQVLEHFLNISFNKSLYNPSNYHKTFEKERNRLNNTFNRNLKERYFETDNISLIDERVPELFNELRKQDIKIALNTGYNKEIQTSIIKKLHMNDFIDGYVSSEEVPKGRPYPYMINKLINDLDVENSKQVVKIGDSAIDILEGRNAKCLLSIGVLSGADGKDKLKDADFLLNSVIDLNYLK